MKNNYLILFQPDLCLWKGMSLNMKNYYEILQVSHNASKEVIEKAYKVLAKKYHPDLQTTYSAKAYAEQKLKEINEAYNILSDDFLREQYDFEFKREKINNMGNRVDSARVNTNDTNNMNYQKQQNFNSNVNKRDGNSKKKRTIEYRYDNIGTMDGAADIIREMFKGGIPERKKRKLGQKDAFAIILTIIIVILIGVVLWFIPFTNSWMREFLFENPFFDFISRLFNK